MYNCSFGICWNYRLIWRIFGVVLVILKGEKNSKKGIKEFSFI